MSMIRIVVLLLVVSICVPVAQGTNGWAAAATVVVLIGGFVLYLSPLMVAFSRGHPNRTAIAVLNVFLGWTFLFWVVSLVWAYTAPKATVIVEAPQPVEEPAWMQAKPRSFSDQTPLAGPTPVPVRLCPFCAEEIRPAAIKCKHCGSDLPAIA